MGKVDSYWYRGVGEYYCSCQWVFILTLGKYFPGVLCQAGVHCWGAWAGFSVRSINTPALLVSVTSTDIHVGSPRGFNNQAFGCIVTDLLWPQDSCVTPNLFLELFGCVYTCCRIGPSRLASFTLAMQGLVAGSANRAGNNTQVISLVPLWLDSSDSVVVIFEIF